MKIHRAWFAGLVAIIMLASCMNGIAFAQSEAKWTEVVTNEGWVCITQEGGETLGYSLDSGVTIIEDDGYAFKDLNRNGVLDTYEDWRLDDTTRAMDLAGIMTGEEIIPLMTHGGWSSFGSTIEGDDLVYIQNGGRSGVTRFSSYEGNAKMAVTWTNALQALAESESYYGIPATISVDPHNVSNTIDMLGLGATMDPELAKQIGIEVSKEYRSVGITMLLGPQVDIIGSPAWARSNGTYTEDPALARDLAAAYMNGLQSTYDDAGNDIGWGADSIACNAKHFIGTGASEGGRFDHNAAGKYTIFPGGAFEAHLIPFFDGAFQLDSTGSVAGVMMNYAVSYSDDGSLGELVGSAYSEFKHNLLKEIGFAGMIITDWGILESTGGFGACWGMEDYSVPERVAVLFKNGVCQIGGSSNIDVALEGYDLMVEELGEKAALKIVQTAAEKILVNSMHVGIFENPYITTERAINTIWTPESKAFGDYTQEQAVIMLKNEGNIIKPYDASAEKMTAYVPYTIHVGGNQWGGYTYDAEPCVDVELVGKYYNVVTDTLGEPTGIDEKGNTVHTLNDIIRASTEDIATCDIAIVKMAAPYTASDYDAEAGIWTPVSIQYEEYTADSDSVRQESVSGDTAKEEIDTIYGPVSQEIKENRSYFGNTAMRPRTYSSFETLKFVDSVVSKDCKVVVYMEMTYAGMVWSEVEPLADAILVRYKDGAILIGSSSVGDQVVIDLIVGVIEPNGLLPVQQPSSMEAIEASFDDLPRDVECYVDADGNVYDFAFGLNWSGVINDARVQTYSVPALTEPETSIIK